MSLRIQAHGASDIGLARENNEDAWFLSLEDGLFLVADGLGGHQAGEVASKEAVEHFSLVFRELKKDCSLCSEEEIFELLRTCFFLTNDRLFTLSCSHDLLRGMGTTFCSLSFHHDKIAVSHIGDSRIYRLRDNMLEQLTKDHCWARPVWGFEGRSSKGVLTKALGTNEQVEPTIRVLGVKEADLFLICSDGLSDTVSHAELERFLQMKMTVGERVRSLIALAKQHHGGDNITVLVAEVVRHA